MDQPPKSAQSGMDALAEKVHACRRCPRLVEWREARAEDPPKRFEGDDYWARPLDGFGDRAARLAIVGLAPAAHGGNRTGRIFTGDRSGDWLFASLHRTGLAAIPTSTHAGDGQRLLGARVVASVRCAPPANKPTPAERAACLPWLTAELKKVAATVRSIVVLGGYGWQALWPALREAGYALPSRRPAFAHGAEVPLTGPDGAPVLLLGCYHPSQQ